MEVQQHSTGGLDYLAILPDGYDPDAAYPLVVLLHGFGANMTDLASLAPALGRRGYVYVAPNGPLRVRVAPNQVGFGWTPPGGTGAEEYAWRAEELLAPLFDEVLERYRVPPGRAVLLGFSQGGGMTYRCGLGRPDVFAGLVALSSVLPDLDVLRERLPAERTQHVFIAHGIHDDIVFLHSAEQAKAFLEEAGYHPVYREYPMGHEISPDLVADLAEWLHRVLPPAPEPEEPREAN